MNRSSIKLFNSQISFGVVKNKAELKEVLKVRKSAYVRAQKISPSTPLEEMTDRFDKNSVIIYAKTKGQVIGSVRVVLAKKFDELEHHRFINLSKLKLKAHECVGITRLCVDPRYQGSDVATELLNFSFYQMVLLGRKYLISGATEKEMKFYRKYGMSPTGLYYENKDLKGLRHELMLFNVEQFVTQTNHYHCGFHQFVSRGQALDERIN